MAKVKRNINAEDLIRDIKVSPKALAAIGDFWVKRIQGFTRSGTSLVTGKPLNPLSGAAAHATANKQFAAEQRSIKALNRKTGYIFPADNSLKKQFINEAGGGGYVGFRMQYTGPTGKAFAPAKSNLTLTGQLLESLEYSTDKSRQTIKVKATGSRNGEPLTNNKLAGYVAEQGRPFLGLDEKGRARMIRLIIDDLRRTLRNRKTGFRKLSRMVGG